MRLKEAVESVPEFSDIDEFDGPDSSKSLPGWMAYIKI